jgi:hypothetical protein
MEIILVNTGDKFSEWYVENMKHMLDQTGCKYNKIHVIRDVEFGGVYDKLQMFRDFTENTQYLYFDLDIVIRKPIDFLLRHKLTVLRAWWRDSMHTPLNSSIMSWVGDNSYIYKNFKNNEDINLLKYNKGIDEYLFKECDIDTYNAVCTSHKYHGWKDFPVIIFNQEFEKMKEEGPWSRYTLLG